MDPKPKEPTILSKTIKKPSAVKAMISWLIKADRECRVAQSMLDETHKKF